VTLPFVAALSGGLNVGSSILAYLGLSGGSCSPFWRRTKVLARAVRLPRFEFRDVSRVLFAKQERHQGHDQQDNSGTHQDRHRQPRTEHATAAIDRKVPVKIAGRGPQIWQSGHHIR
jgi:hypothetical protein